MDHLSADEFAALDRGDLPEPRLAHLADCDDCAAHLDTVGDALAGLPVPPMPAEVAAGLDAVVAAESRRRTSGAAEQEERARQAAHAKRVSLGSFGDNSPRRDALANKAVRPAQPTAVTPNRRS